MSDKSLLDVAPDDIKETSESVEMVQELRINYKSGAFFQTWFKRFDDDGVSIQYELADVHESATNKLTRPLLLRAMEIESVWIMQEITAQELYNKSYTV